MLKSLAFFSLSRPGNWEDKNTKNHEQWPKSQYFALLSGTPQNLLPDLLLTYSNFLAFSGTLIYLIGEAILPQSALFSRADTGNW